MSVEFREKTVLVFGGSSGIGAALCELLLHAGAQVCCADIKPEALPLEEKYGKDKHMFTEADVTSTDSIEAAFQRVEDAWQRTTDIVVYCCGILHEFEFEKCIDVNFTGTVRTLLASLRHMGKDKGGKGGVYLSVSSINSLIACPFCPVYAGTKAGMNALTRSYSHQYHFSKHGVRINTILPGSVPTPLHDDATAERIFIIDTFLASEKNTPIMSSDYVAKEMAGILKDPDMNGQCLLITRLGGLEPVTFEREEEYQSKRV